MNQNVADEDRLSRFYYLVEQHLSALACLPHADLMPRALGVCGTPAHQLIRPESLQRREDVFQGIFGAKVRIHIIYR